MSSKPIVLTVLGARPQFIKAAPVSLALAQAGFDEHLIHTGQHYDKSMSDVFFEELGIPDPWRNLAIGSGFHGAQTGQMMIALEPVVQELKPDLVLIYGDTNSTLAGALVASKLHVPLAHVEAGLRSHNRHMPEEVNRLVADVLADWCFAPTEVAEGNLLAEGVPPHKVLQVGDVMLDAVRLFEDRARAMPFEFAEGFVLSTLHRAALVDDPDALRGVVHALGTLSEAWTVIMPLHPRTAKAINTLGLVLPPTLICLPPQSYISMLGLLQRASVVVTDSGGLQKEAYFAGKPCVTVRNETEWTELVASGWNVLAGERPNAEALVALVGAQLGKDLPRIDFYGDGRASQRIAQALRNF